MKTVVRLGVSLFLLVNSQILGAYEPNTHREIALQSSAPTVSTVDQTLKIDLGIVEGIEKQFLKKSARTWIGEGARLEDHPQTRAFQHFHNPLAPWQFAGLSVADGLSSILWQQYLAQNIFPHSEGGGNWSWQDARYWYRKALTSAISAEREQAFANTFRALGQLTHLVQDASVPAHTRNDPHLLWEGYESWVNTTQRIRPALFQQLLASALLPSQIIFTPTNSTEAPVPVARLIDTDTFDGSNGVVLTGDTIGMAEYTNGNFVSDNTIFTSDFLLPRLQSLGPGFSYQKDKPSGSTSRKWGLGSK